MQKRWRNRKVSRSSTRSTEIMEHENDSHSYYNRCTGALKVLLSLYKESTNYWLPIIHSFGFHAEEGHPLSLSYSKKESGSNDILYIL